MPIASDELSRVFAALSDPTRRDILSRLSSGPVTAGELAGGYDMSRPAISQHLTVLENAGLIARTVHAQWRECRVQADGLDDAMDWVARHRAGWNQRLDFLETHLKATRAKEEE